MDSASIDLSILIVTYNCADDLRVCLDSVEKHVRGVSYEVIVRDNASKDAAELVEICAGRARLVLGADNPGFGVANNEVATLSRGDFLVFLNPDTYLIEDCLTPLINHIRHHDDCGAVAPILKNPDGTLQDSWGDSTGLMWEFLEGNYLQGLMRNRAWKNKKGLNTWPVLYASGACLCTSKSTWLSAGCFDPDFFLNYEDIELCNRINRRGKSIHIFAQACLIHAEGSTQRLNWERYTFHRQQSRWIYHKKRFKGLAGAIAKALWWESILLKYTIGTIILRGTDRSRLSGFRLAMLWVLQGTKLRARH